LHLEVTREPTQFTVHGYIDIQRSKQKKALPSINMFKGFGGMFGGEKAVKEKKAEEK